ncbi:hypothetical protein RADP37_05561 [Roseomonas mucosa]|uniref:Uncharacterized protein n=1 Tax=Roseomonas mucosa TaxID=207340 RepID=A0A4Y1MWW5_9PROT|nr:hypothetical protein RADP37_05561 [Roseomonas mucosa]
MNAAPKGLRAWVMPKLDGKWRRWDDFRRARAPFLDVHEQHKKM